VRVGELGSVQIPHLVSRPWAEPQWKQKKLDRFFIVNVSWTETQGEFIITRRAGRPSDGYHVSFDVNQAVTITAINENGLATEAPRRLDGDAGAGLRAVWMQILRQMSTWAHGSRQLVHAELNGDEVVAAPDAVAAALLATIEPVLMALGQARSHVCDGPLLGRIARLSEGHRQLIESVVRGTEPAEEVRQAPVAPNPSIRSRQRGASSRREIARRLSRRPPPPARNMPAAS